jgi:predicted metal-dependent hydrolase
MAVIGILCLFGGIALLIGTFAFFESVVGPRLEDRRQRRNRLLAAQDKRQERLEELMFKWQLENVNATFAEQQAHKKRLEQNLDALHSGKPLEGE